MRDIVIPYLRNNSGELEACISLIKKNVPHRNIYVVEEYESIRHSTISHINQILKLKWAIENLDLTDEFYLFNDDFFVLNPVEDIPYYHKGLLVDQVAKRNVGRYSRALKSTLEFLGDEALSYEVHIPFLFDKKKLHTAIVWLEPEIASGKCPLIRSVYGNAYEVGGEEVIDVKNISDYEGETFLSTTESSFKRGIGDYIRSQL